MVSLHRIKKVLEPVRNTMPEDNYRILKSWTKYEDGIDKKRPLKYIGFEFEAIDPETGEKSHLFKAVKFAKVTRIPKSAKQSTSLMDMQTQVLSAAYGRGYNLVTIIANIMKPTAIGLMYLYGVQGIADTFEEAVRRAESDYIGLINSLEGTFRTLHLRHINAEEAEWLRAKMFSMSYLTVVKGIPNAKTTGEDMGNKGIGGKNINPDSEGTIEEIVTAMSDYEYIIQVLSSPVYQRTLESWLLRNEKQMTDYQSQMQGTKSLSFNLSIPFMYMASTGATSGWSKSFSNARTVSYTQGESYSNGYSHSTGRSLSESIGESFGVSKGTSVTNSVGKSYSVSNGITQGTSQGASYGQTVGHTDGTTQGLTQGRTIGQTQGYNQSVSQSVSVGGSRSQTISQSNNKSIGLGLSNSYGYNQSQGSNVGKSLSNSIGSSYSQNQSQSSSLSHTLGTSENHGTSTSHSSSQSVGYNSSSSHTDGSSVGMSYGKTSGTTQGHTVNASHSQGTGENWSGSQSKNPKIVATALEGKNILYNYGDTDSKGGSKNDSWTNGDSYSGSVSNSQNAGINFGASSSDSTSHGKSASFSTSDGYGTSDSYGKSESYGTSQSNSYGESFGTSYGQTSGLSYGNSVSRGSSQNIGQSQNLSNSQGLSIGTSSSISYNRSQGSSVGFSQSVSQSESLSQSQSKSASDSLSNSYTQNISNSLSQSQSESNGTSTSQSLGESQSTSQTTSQSTSTGQTVGDSNSVTNGTSRGTSTGTSTGIGQGVTGGFTQGTSGSMGLGPSIGYNKSYQWIDQQVQDVVKLLTFEHDRLMMALNTNCGAFYTCVYIACSSLDGLVTAQASAKSTWQNEFALTNPLQVLDLTEEEQAKLLLHFSGFSMDVTRENVHGANQYKYETILLPKEYVAYTHLPRISGGGIDAISNDIPKFRVPAMMTGDIFMGTVLNSERFTFRRGYKTESDYRMNIDNLMHGVFTGQSRSGKTVAAMRFVRELCRSRRTETGKRLRIVVMDPKQDWRGIARFVEPERLNFYSLGNSLFHAINMNPCKIPKGVQPQYWIDGLVNIYCRSYGLLERGKQMMSDAFYALYKAAGVFEVADKEGWEEKVPDLSAKVTFAAVYRWMEYKRNGLDANGRRAGNDTRDAYARLLERLSCFSRQFSIERKLFSKTLKDERGETPEPLKEGEFQEELTDKEILEDVGPGTGCGIDDLIGGDDVTVFESFGLESTFSSFIFGIITSGFYKVAKGYEKGFRHPDQYETVLVIEEANKVLTGSDTAGTGGSDSATLTGQSEFEEILDQAAGYGLFIIAITQKISMMPSSIIANCGMIFVGRLTTPDDVNLSVRMLGREERFEDRDVVKWLPMSPTGWFICRQSRGYDFLEAEPVLVAIEPLNAADVSNRELDEIIAKKEFSKITKTA